MEGREVTVIQLGASAPRRYPGQLTARVAQSLQGLIGSKCKVYCGNRLRDGTPPCELSEIPVYRTHNGNEIDLGFADIAVLDVGGELRALVEIEETSCPPKKIDGDLHLCIEGEEVGLKGVKRRALGPQTRRIVLYRKPGTKASEKLKYLQDQAKQLSQSAAPAGGTDVPYVGDFDYHRNGVHAPGTAGEAQLAAKLAELIRKEAGL
jgi:hypothetical protein